MATDWTTPKEDWTATSAISTTDINNIGKNLRFLRGNVLVTQNVGGDSSVSGPIYVSAAASFDLGRHVIDMTDYDTLTLREFGTYLPSNCFLRIFEEGGSQLWESPTGGKEAYSYVDNGTEYGLVGSYTSSSIVLVMKIYNNRTSTVHLFNYLGAIFTLGKS